MKFFLYSKSNALIIGISFEMLDDLLPDIWRFISSVDIDFKKFRIKTRKKKS